MLVAGLKNLRMEFYKEPVMEASLVNKKGKLPLSRAVCNCSNVDKELQPSIYFFYVNGVEKCLSTGREVVEDRKKLLKTESREQAGVESLSEPADGGSIERSFCIRCGRTLAQFHSKQDGPEKKSRKRKTKATRRSKRRVLKNHFGHIEGIPVGSCWFSRQQVSKCGIHPPPVAGIHGRASEGAFSLVISGKFKDDIDRGEEFVYTGSGGCMEDKTMSDQPVSELRMNMRCRSLALNCDAPVDDRHGATSKDWKKGKPVRVVRNHKCRRFSDYAPRDGNRYDGLYKVVKYWPEKNKVTGVIVWKYLMRRDDLCPAPWTKDGKEIIERLGLKMKYPEDEVDEGAAKVNSSSKSDNSDKETLKKGSKRRASTISDTSDHVENGGVVCGSADKSPEIDHHKEETACTVYVDGPDNVEMSIVDSKRENTCTVYVEGSSDMEVVRMESKREAPVPTRGSFVPEITKGSGHSNIMPKIRRKRRATVHLEGSSSNMVAPQFIGSEAIVPGLVHPKRFCSYVQLPKISGFPVAHPPVVPRPPLWQPYLDSDRTQSHLIIQH